MRAESGGGGIKKMGEKDLFKLFRSRKGARVLVFYIVDLRLLGLLSITNSLLYDYLSNSIGVLL